IGPSVVLRVRLAWYTLDKDFIGFTTGVDITTPGVHYVPTTQAPAGTRYARLVPELVRAAGDAQPGDTATMTDIMVTHDPATFAATYDYTDPYAWSDLLGPTHAIQITRQGFNLGTLTAEILDADLDPSVSATIRPGKR